MPPLDHLQFVKQKGIRSALFLAWHEISPSELLHLSLFDDIFCMNADAAETLLGLGISNTVVCGWDNGRPFFTKRPQAGSVSVLLPLWDGNARRTELTAVEVLRRAVLRQRDVTATVAITASTVSGPGYAAIRRACRESGGKIKLVRNVSELQTHFLLATHDLVLCPYHFDNANLVATAAITAGSPVVTFLMPTNRCVLSESNSISDPVRYCRTPTGAPMASPCYKNLDDALYFAVSDTAYVRNLCESIDQGRLQRRENFHDNVSGLWRP